MPGTARAGPFRGRKVVGKYESRHLEFTISGGRFFRGRRRPRRARPAASCLLTLVARGYGVVLILLCANILCRRSGGQGLCRATTLQPRGRAFRRSPWPWKVFITEAESFADALKRLMHDGAAGVYWQDTRSNHREESSEPSAASHGTSAAPPSSDAAMRPLLETRALSGEPSTVFIPGADCAPAHARGAFHA